MKNHILFTGSITMLFAMLLFISNGAFADIVIGSGATMKVSSGTKVVMTGDLTNNGTADLGDGEIVFTGSGVSAIGGSTVSEFGDLTVDKAVSLALAQDIRVDGILDLTQGWFDVDTYDMSLGESATISGTFSSSIMIVADQGGHVIKEFPDGAGADPAAFLFPIGDLTLTAYTPIEIDFTTGDFTSGSISVNLTTSKEPNNSSSDSYINRYWTLANSGISNYKYSISAIYADGDIVGTEADMSGALYDGSSWFIGEASNAATNTLQMNGIDRGGNFTGVEFRILANMELILEGAYSSTTNEMTTALNSDIPLDAATAYAEFGYTGTESVGSIPSTDIVDWVLVEVRDATSPSNATSATLVETVAGFLLKDGSIVGLDGVSPLSFKALITNNAYFVFRHRNHLAVMTASSPSNSFGNYTYNLSDDLSKAYNSFAPDPSMVQVDTSPVVYALFAGETNNSDFITVADKVPIQANMDFIGYHIADCNFSGFVTVADKLPIQRNMDMYSHVPF